MVNGSLGMSGHNFDAFVSSQQTYNEPDWAAKIQEKYWRARHKFLSKIEKKEDNCIVFSDSKLDAKLEIYRSIDRSCDRLTDILESYQNCLFVFANEENALGILLKECGKHDKTKAGKIMTLTGKSLTQSSHQLIRLYMPLLRLYQEMETFHSRAVEDTATTVDKLESMRSQYRSSLLWMKNISEKLDPDVYRQLDKFRRVQNKVRDDKKAFDGMQMDVVQKIDLLMASRCNLMNQTLGPYQNILLESFEKNHNNFKSVEEMIKGEDLYEYEFKTLKQLNPLKIDDDSPPKNIDDSSPSEPTNNKDLIGALEEEEGDRNNNNNNLPKGELARQQRASSELINVETPDSRKENATRSGIDSLVSVDNNVEEEDELTNSLDLLDNLFGSSHSSDLKDDPTGSCKSRRREDEVKALRSNLNANLLDVDDEDEAKQVATLLGFSEQSSSYSMRRDSGPLSEPKQDDIFAKWAKDAEGPSDKAADFGRRASDGARIDNMDQDLMDIGGGAAIPKATNPSLEDFLA